MERLDEILEIDKGDNRKASTIILGDMYDMLVSDRVDEFNDYLIYFNKLDFSILTQVNVIRITKPHKAKFLIREEMIEKLKIACENKSIKQAEIDNVLLNIV